MLGQQLGQVAFRSRRCGPRRRHSRIIIAARRWPSRSRPSCNCVSACWAACRRGGAPDLGIERVVAALAGPVEQFHQAGRGDVGQDAARGLQLLGQRLEPGRVETGHVGAGIAREGHADLDLPRAPVAPSAVRAAFPWRSSSGRRKYRSRKRLLRCASVLLAPGLPWRCRRRSCCGSWCVYPVLCRRDGASRPPAGRSRARGIAAGYSMPPRFAVLPGRAPGFVRTQAPNAAI